MATKSGSFKGRNGHTYQVALSGDSVGSGSLVFAGGSPVVIGMASGEHKFCGLKTQTCRLSIVTDEPLTDLYGSSARAVSLTVVDYTTGERLFAGYVTPFAYSQPCSGKMDVVEIDAVDRLTAHKDVEYANIGTPHGVDQTALDLVKEICRRSFVYKIVVHDNFSNGESLSGTMVAQAGFLQDKVSDPDALSAIAKFFGYTAHMVGDTLYMYDEHCLTRGFGGVTRWVYQSGWSSSYDSLGVQSATEVRDVTVSVERAYDGIQITPEGSEVSVLLPDVCDDEQLEDLDYDDGKSGKRRTFSNGSVTDYRTPRRSKVLATGKGGASLTNFVATSSVDYMTATKISEIWKDGSIPMRYVRYEKNEVMLDWVSAKVSVPTLRESGNMLWVRCLGVPSGKVLIAQQRSACRYSHTGGYVRVSAAYKARYGYGEEMLPPTDEDQYKDPHRMWWLQVACGSGWLVMKSATDILGYSQCVQGVSPFILSDGKLVVSEDSTTHNEDEYVFAVNGSGQVYLEMANLANQGAMLDLFFTSLKMEGVGDKINLESTQMRYGDGTGEVLEVRTMLTSRDSGVNAVSDQNGKIRYGVNARPGVVPDANWSGGYYAGQSGYSGIPMSGVLLEQLTERYTQPRMAYQMTVRDVLMPYCAVAYKGGEYTVEAYEMDLYESETRVTID